MSTPNYTNLPEVGEQLYWRTRAVVAKKYMARLCNVDELHNAIIASLPIINKCIDEAVKDGRYAVVVKFTDIPVLAEKLSAILPGKYQASNTSEIVNDYLTSIFDIWTFAEDSGQDGKLKFRWRPQI